MVTPPLYCCLLPLTGQMERGKAQQGDGTSVVAPFPLPRTRAQVVQHNSAQSCPPMSIAHNSHPIDSFLPIQKKKKSFLYLLIDCSVNFSQANWISHFLTFQEPPKWNKSFICRIWDSNLRGVKRDTKVWRFLRKWIAISFPTWNASVEGGS